MGYTIIEYLEATEQNQKRSIGTFDCAYEAVDAIRAALQKKNERVWGWYLVDEVGTVLFGPTDLAAIMAESDEFEARPPTYQDRHSQDRDTEESRPRERSELRGRAVTERGRRKERHGGGLLSDSDLLLD